MTRWSPGATALEPGPERAGPVVHPAVSVGVLKVGGARGDVGHDDRPAVGHEPLGERGTPQVASGGPAHPLAELRLASDRQTSPSPSSRTMVLPSSPCAAGRQPVAMHADVTRVTEGNTPVQAGEVRRGLGESGQGRRRRAVMRSRRRLSQTTRTARRMGGAYH